MGKPTIVEKAEEDSSEKKAIKSSDGSSEETDKAPKADAVKAEKRYKLQNRIEHMKSRKKDEKKGRKKKFHRQNILIADEVVAEKNGESSTIKSKVATGKSSTIKSK